MMHLPYEALRRSFVDSSHGISRRDVLRTALATAGGLMCCERSPAAVPSRDRPRVLVIGAGFAGLSCADELASVGYPVTVIEARDRVGGRVVTWRDLVEGKTVEGGGELVGPNQPTWMAYAKRFGLNFVELSWDSGDTIVLGNERIPPDTARELWNGMRLTLERLNDLAAPIDALQPWKSPNARQLDLQSLDSWILALDAPARIKQLITIQLTGINGIIPAWQSLLGMLAIVRGGGLQKFWDDTDTLHCVGGTQQLAQKLAESFVKQRGTDALRMNSPVRAIRVTADRVFVTLHNDQVLEADEVVLTVPPTTWSKLAFDPPLPPDLQVPMAASTKYLAVFAKPEWQAMGRRPNALATGPVQVTWEATAGQGEAGPHALVAFAGGAEADEGRSWPPNEREARYRAALDRLYPGIGPAMLHGRFVDWVSDPWAKGTYSFPAPGQVTLVGPKLDAGHHRRVHFAGEHVCYAFTGWMEGALMSGTRTARKLAERDGVRRPASE